MTEQHTRRETDKVPEVPVIPQIPEISTKPATHMHTLSITTATPEDWDNVHSALGDMLLVVGKDYPSVSLSSFLLDNDPGVETETEFYDQYTEERVHRALVRSGLSPMRATGALNCMKDAGILFRERTP